MNENEHSSKVTLKVPKLNNFVHKKHKVIKDMKYLIICETLLGVNRLYLLGYRKLVLRFSYIYTLVILFCIGTILILNNLNSASQLIYKNTSGVEYWLLGLSALLTQKNQLNKLFLHLQSFDKYLNISDKFSVTGPKRWWIQGIGSVVLSNVAQVLFLQFFVFRDEGFQISYSMYAMYIPGIIHDCEIVFFGFLMNTIFNRLTILKAHVAKELSVDEEKEDSRESNELYELSQRVDLDSSSLYKTYDLLHKCAEHLNCVMSLPVITMLVASGLSTIIVLKIDIKIMITESNIGVIALRSIIIFGVARCLKYVVLLTYLCYLSNKSHAQVVKIRVVIHDALLTSQLEKIERRKLKALYYLTLENEFAYALWGVVRLDMSLPLSYSSLCTTYLIIIVQFSRFID